MSFAPAGGPVSSQTAGDCQENVCDGVGGITTQPDDTDVFVDGNQCSADLCTAGTPSNPPSPVGSACSQNGGSFCDGTGVCVECTEGSQCASDQCVANVCAPNLLFSEYVEGSSNNKAIEISNQTGAAVDLTGCAVRIYANGAASPSSSIALSSTLAAGDVWVVCHSLANVALAALCDQLTGSLSFNGDDAVELICNGTTLDVIGQIGVDPGAAWGTAPTSTLDTTLVRKCSVTHGDPTGSDVFDPALEWAGLPLDTFAGLGSPTCAP
jgi:hypothetical protein